LGSFDNQILSLYAKGMSTRDIVSTFKEMYDADITDTVYRDSSGSILSNSAKSLAITQTYEAISAAYTAYTTSLSAGATIATSSAAASGAAQSAFVGVDPYSIAIAAAIQVITKMIACGQQDTATNINTTLASSWAGICIANIITNLCANTAKLLSTNSLTTGIFTYTVNISIAIEVLSANKITGVYWI
jgi:hypothetical protein